MSKTTKQKRTVAQYTGHAGTRRIISSKDQGTILGVKEKVGEDLIWEPGNTKLDVTEVNHLVVDYLKKSGEFKVSEIEVDVEVQDDSEKSTP